MAPHLAVGAEHTCNMIESFVLNCMGCDAGQRRRKQRPDCIVSRRAQKVGEKHSRTASRNPEDNSSCLDWSFISGVSHHVIRSLKHSFPQILTLSLTHSPSHPHICSLRLLVHSLTGPHSSPHSFNMCLLDGQIHRVPTSPNLCADPVRPCSH